MALDKKNILGVDIGGSKIRMVLWDGEKVLKTWQSDTATKEKLKEGLSIFNCQKVGIALPGLLDFKTQKTLSCQNLPEFNGFNVKSCVPVSVRADNDAKCFLRAEMFFKQGEKLKHTLGVIFGTGIGGAIWNYRGANGWAGEFGCMLIERNKTWEKLYQKTKNNPKEQERTNAIGLANLINIFNPEIIFLGGKGAKKPNLKAIENLLIIKKQMPRFAVSLLKENAVAIGAALLWTWGGDKI